MSVRALRRGTMAGRGAAAPTTYTIFGDASDGRLFCRDAFAGYAHARNGTGTKGVSSTTTEDNVGQNLGAGQYFCYQLAYAFDTSAVAGTITSVTLHLYCTLDTSSVDFEIEARLHDFGATVDTADFVAGTDLASKTLLASRSSSGISVGAYNGFTSQAAFLTNINQAGFTRFILASDRQRTGTAPSGTEYVNFALADMSGTSQDPKLVIEALV